MLLRNRLKKEPVNLLKSKNRILLIGLIAYVIVELMIYMPGDIMSPGYSIVYDGTGAIDNYNNVMNYPYSTTHGWTRSVQNYYRLKDMNFSFVENLNIPGMPKTKEASLGFNPQGICIAKDYFLITSYSEEEESLGALMVFNKNTGEHLLTLGMDEKSHLGGITFDGENIWVCNSNNNTLERISYETIQFLVLLGQEEVINISNLVDAYQVDCSPSCVAFYNGFLWVATHNIWSNSQMFAYRYHQQEDDLVFCKNYVIPSQVQGITFSENGEVYLSISYGRKNSSYIKQYQSVYAMNKDVDNYSMLIEMPPCSEELIYYGERLYVLFESAGEKYLKGTDGLGQSICPIDKILIIDLTLP